MNAWPQPFLAVLLLLMSCGRHPQPQLRQESPGATAIELLVEREIAGPLLGKPLQYPRGLAVDSRGLVYVCDAGNNRIIRLDSDLNAEAEIGGLGSHEGAFNRPAFITVDNDLNLLVCDQGNRRICRYNSQLHFVETLPFFDDEDPLRFGYPSGVAVTDYGEVWAADRERNRIALFNNVGRFDRFIGDFGDPGGQLLNPEKILRGPRGDFIVCDAGNSRVVTYDEYGNFVQEVLDPELDYPVAAVADTGGIWLLDRATGRVFRFDRRGHRLLQTGPLLVGNGQPLKEPSDIALLRDGRLIIADTGNNRLLLCRILLHQP